MKIERLKKDNRKKIITIVSIVVLLVMGVIGFVGTRAKYKYTATVPLVSGTIHYKSGDVSVLAVNIQNDNGNYAESDNIPGEGYILNTEKSYCGLSNGDGTYNKLNDITITYENGKVNVLNLSQRGTKCFLYFDKPNYLVASKTEAAAANNDVLGKSMARSSFESITTVASKSVPAGVIDSWDVSERKNGSIMAWYTDTNNNGLYELYIGQDGGVIANPSLNCLFLGYTNVTNIDLINFDTSNVVSMNSMFIGMEKLSNLNVSSFDTRKVTDMGAMFANMSSLTTLDLSNFDTSNVISMAWMFSQASSLTNLNISSFNTSNVIDMNHMFANLLSLTSLDLSNFNTSKVTNMLNMFNNMTSLTSLDLSNFNTSKVTNMQGMFMSLANLTNLNISSFDTSKVTDMGAMFANTTSMQALNLNKATFDNVTNFTNMFYNSSVSTITVKDTNAQGFINSRLSEAGKTATITIG